MTVTTYPAISPVVDTTAVSNMIPLVFAAKLRPIYFPKLGLPRLLRQDLLNVLAAYGQTVTLPGFSEVTTNEFSATGVVQPQSLTQDQKTVTLDQHPESTVVLDNVATLVSRYDLIEAAVVRQLLAHAKKVETFTASLFSTSGLGTPLAGGSATVLGTAGSAITEDVVLAAREFGVTNGWPEEGRYFAVTPSQYSNVIKIPDFNRALVSAQYGDVIPAGRIGRVFGFEFFESPYMPTVSGGYRNIAFSSEFAALVNRPLGAAQMPGVTVREESVNGLRVRILVAAAPMNLALQVTTDALYGGGVIEKFLAVPVNG